MQTFKIMETEEENIGRRKKNRRRKTPRKTTKKEKDGNESRVWVNTLKG